MLTTFLARRAVAGVATRHNALHMALRAHASKPAPAVRDRFSPAFSLRGRGLPRADSVRWRREYETCVYLHAPPDRAAERAPSGRAPSGRLGLARARSARPRRTGMSFGRRAKTCACIVERCRRRARDPSRTQHPRRYPFIPARCSRILRYGQVRASCSRDSAEL